MSLLPPAVHVGLILPTQDIERPTVVWRHSLSRLADYEFENLLKAIRRDMHCEQDRANTDKEWASVHRMNARNDVHLLEILNPKQRGEKPCK